MKAVVLTVAQGKTNFLDHFTAGQKFESFHQAHLSAPEFEMRTDLAPKDPLNRPDADADGVAQSCQGSPFGGIVHDRVRDGPCARILRQHDAGRHGGGALQLQYQQVRTRNGEDDVPEVP
jgi:hypothetical protein